MPSPSWHIAMLASDLSPSAKVLLSRLAVYQGRNLNAWPKLETLAKGCALSPRYARQLLRRCELAGWVLTKRVKGKGSSYALTFPTALKTTTQNDDTPDEFIRGGGMNSSGVAALYPLLDESNKERGGYSTQDLVPGTPGEPRAERPDYPPPSLLDSSQRQRQGPQCNSEGGPNRSQREKARGDSGGSLDLSELARFWLAQAPKLSPEEGAWLANQAQLALKGFAPFASTLAKARALTDSLTCRVKREQLSAWLLNCTVKLEALSVQLSASELSRHVKQARAGDHRIPYSLDPSQPPELLARAVAEHLAQGSAWLESGGPERYREALARHRDKGGGSPRRPSRGLADHISQDRSGLTNASGGALTLRLVEGGQARNQRRRRG